MQDASVVAFTLTYWTHQVFCIFFCIFFFVFFFFFCIFLCIFFLPFNTLFSPSFDGVWSWSPKYFVFVIDQQQQNHRLREDSNISSISLLYVKVRFRNFKSTKGFPNVSWSTSELRVRLAAWRRETGLSLPVKYFTDRSKAVPLFWIIFCILCF